MKIKSFSITILFLFTLYNTNLTAESVQAVDKNFRFVTANSLKFRDQPDLNSKTLQIIPQGKIVSVIETKKEKQIIAGVEGRWAKVRYRWEEGWVFDGFLKNFNIDKKEKQITDVYGKWNGSWSCGNDKTNLTLNNDKTFYAWIFQGAEMGGCGGDGIFGTWEIDADSNICLTNKENKYYLFIWKGILVADMNYPNQLKENFGHEIFSGLKK
jgi:hypothetical protein